ncbi:calmodulin [Acrasis kona]|uniref:Calmodulin n=1 Tax=Acrasis kona TaxID=1008807 RepID=A0AAW2ZA84_9EUKA
MTAINELFEQHAKDGYIPTKVVPQILRELGIKDIKDSDVLNEIDADGTFSKFQYQDLVNYYYQKLREEDAEKEIVSALKVHFPCPGDDTFLTREQMKEVVCKIGSKLSEDEVTEIINELDQNNTGKISALHFATCLMKSQ